MQKLVLGDIKSLDALVRFEMASKTSWARRPSDLRAIISDHSFALDYRGKIVIKMVARDDDQPASRFLCAPPRQMPTARKDQSPARDRLRDASQYHYRHAPRPGHTNQKKNHGFDGGIELAASQTADSIWAVSKMPPRRFSLAELLPSEGTNGSERSRSICLINILTATDEVMPSSFRTARQMSL